MPWSGSKLFERLSVDEEQADLLICQNENSKQNLKQTSQVNPIKSN